MEEIPGNAQKFAARVKKNVEDWNFDGVDFFYLVSFLKLLQTKKKSIQFWHMVTFEYLISLLVVPRR